LSFCSSQIAGERWALLPSAAGFVNPLLSTGFPLSLLGVLRLAEAIERDWGQPSFQGALQNYAAQTHGDLMAAQSLIGALYANMDDFEVFTALSLLYFAAASFSETARRLERPELAGSFLLRDDERFGPALAAICKRARQPMTPHEKEGLVQQIHRAIEPFDVAGLVATQTGAAREKNWYPVDAADLMNARDKVGASRAEIEQLLERSGFYCAGASRSST
jgi:FADH2 O2-dependent halogenase